jgi:alanyl-tRNA synthetase
VVDPSIGQAGSLVDFERLRFDFHCPRAVTPAELEQIEALINGWIADAHALEVQEMAIEQARSAGAVAMFGEKYGDVVRVVDVPGVSMELCGGTHVANTAEIGLFKIVAEAGVAAGIRRIEAVAGPAVLAYLNERDAVVRALGDRFKAQPGEIVERVAALQEELRGSQKALAAVRGELAVANAERVLEEKIQDIKVDNRSYRLLIGRVDGIEGGDLKTAAKQLQERSGGNSLVIITSVTKGKVGFGTSFGKDVANEYSDLDAGRLTNEYSRLCGGGGGGNKYQAQAGGRDPSALDEAMREAEVTIRKILIKGPNSKQIYQASIIKPDN